MRVSAFASAIFREFFYFFLQHIQFMLISSSVETSNTNEKCEFYATAVILESVSARSFWCDVEKNSQELPVDGVDNRRNPSELKSDELTEGVH
jgi:steroid 5-alpha reductase family enzyme